MGSHRKKVLIISFHYPPSPAASPAPIYGWVSHLPEYGWDALVLTSNWHSQIHSGPSLKNNVIVAPYRQAFKYLVNLRVQIQNRKIPFKLLNFILINFLLYPDDMRGWYKPAYRKGLMLLRQHNIDLILSSGAPWTDFWVASRLSRNTRIPWIAHYRDTWTQLTSQGFRAKWIIQKAISRLIENKIVKTADCCIHASDVWASQLGRMVGKKTYWIPNGYDPEVFIKLAKTEPKKEPFYISYVGTLHFTQKLDPFLIGFEKFIRTSRVQPEMCKLNFVGTSGVKTIIKKYNTIQKYVKNVPYIAKSDAIKFMLQSHILLLFLNNDTGWCPAKIYEYLASERWILASPNNSGVINRLLKETNAGIVLDKPVEIANWLKMKFNEFIANGYKQPNTNLIAVQKYSRNNQVKRLVQILNDTVVHQIR